MNIKVTTKKFRLTDDMERRIEKKLGKLDRYFSSDTTAAVRLYTQRSDEIAEVTVVSGGLTFRADARSEEMFDSLEKAVDSLVRQLEKHKTRLEKRLKIGAFDGTAAAPEDNFELIKQKRFEVRPMDVEEAILQMNLLGHSFFVFRDIATESVSVVYRRRDGGYGLIMTE
ncbi:MAG TPA: ribosome-associated translation inhibitor RaiA [Candidatus Acidoferrum sp.]|nr:ribosome-associated translation inhibitor RaiA [Candidatus Acidoferrum sp.]